VPCSGITRIARIRRSYASCIASPQCLHKSLRNCRYKCLRESLRKFQHRCFRRCLYQYFQVRLLLHHNINRLLPDAFMQLRWSEMSDRGASGKSKFPKAVQMCLPQLLCTYKGCRNPPRLIFFQYLCYNSKAESYSSLVQPE
jgi:hypothetical protein